MKYMPYQEVMNFDEERDEYIKLCRGKSKKYTYYTDWEEHIKGCILKINTKKNFCNFKHYCISRERTTSKMPEMFSVYSTLFLTFCFNKIDNILLSVILTVLLLLGAIMYMITQHKIAIYESSFFKDIIGIIEKVESEQI